jgi:tRNA(Ile2)-agmatinylcytidine synthase
MDIAGQPINNSAYMRIGIDDTDSPAGMCTTYLGAVLADRLSDSGMTVRDAILVRLNPNVIHKTRGNAAICLDVSGDPGTAFEMACKIVEEMADFSCEDTNPGVVVAEEVLPEEFYKKAVRDFCEIDEAIALLTRAGALFRGYKNGRGLIGAAAAVASSFEDQTSEILVYRKPDRWGTPRKVVRESLFLAERETCPHTWDTVDTENDVVVCVPHTPDPVLFGIRGESGEWVLRARRMVVSEDPDRERIFSTNQGTDAHLVKGSLDAVQPGRSYLIRGRVSTIPVTGSGGHVSFMLSEGTRSVRCMAYEPTKGFRNMIRMLRPGDEIVVAGSYKEGSINLEKTGVISVIPLVERRAPFCVSCGKRMTSAGKDKGYKCRTCGIRQQEPDLRYVARELKPGWYEVPPSARRHLARPLCRGQPNLSDKSSCD